MGCERRRWRLALEDVLLSDPDFFRPGPTGPWGAFPVIRVTILSGELDEGNAMLTFVEE